MIFVYGKICNMRGVFIMIDSNSIYNNASIPLTEDFIKKVVINFITMTIDCEKYIPRFPDKFEPYKAFYQFLKDDTNKGTSVYNSIINLNDNLIKDAVQFGKYTPLLENGNQLSPITANQIGWYSYQSWHLSNDNRYNKGEISHRFYISADSSIIPKFIVVLKEKLEQMAIPYYFKVSSASIVGNTQKDGIVIYSSTNNLNQVILALQEIQNEYPDIVQKCNEPHLFCGNINGWIGYANEIKNQKNSYTNLMSKIMYDSFEASVLDWIRENSEVTINDGSKNVKVSQYFNRNIINEESQKDYITYIKRLGHLINVIPKFDKNFKPKLYRIIKNNLIKNNIDPNNICFNFDVLEELVEYNNHLTKSQDITNHNTDFKI